MFAFYNPNNNKINFVSDVNGIMGNNDNQVVILKPSSCYEIHSENNNLLNVPEKCCLFITIEGITNDPMSLNDNYTSFEDYLTTPHTITLNNSENDEVLFEYKLLNNTEHLIRLLVPLIIDDNVTISLESTWKSLVFTKFNAIVITLNEQKL